MTTMSPSPSTNQTQLEICDLYGHSEVASFLLPVYYSIVFIIGILGNGLAMFVIIKNRKKINSTTVYSANLVISDLLFSIALPTRIMYCMTHFNWPFGEVHCKIMALFFYLNSYASVNFMTCLSVDRVIAVVHPQRRNLRTIKKAMYICFFLWFITLAKTVPFITLSLSHQDGNKITCHEYLQFRKQSQFLPQLLLSACIWEYLVPLGIVITCYLRISYKLYQIAKTNPLTTNKTPKMITVIILVYIICLTPFHLTIIVYESEKLMWGKIPCNHMKVFQEALHYTVTLMNLNCSLDPFIYFFACKGYRKAIVSIMKLERSLSVSIDHRDVAINGIPLHPIPPLAG